MVMMFKTKRIYGPPGPADGCRVLVDRIWPRGVSKEKARIDLWMREIAPSDRLRKWFGHDPQRWIEFRERYREELKTKAELIHQLKELGKRHGRVTLIYSARDEGHNQALALCEFLDNAK